MINTVRLLTIKIFTIKIFAFTFSGMLKEFGGGLELTENWNQSVF